MLGLSKKNIQRLLSFASTQGHNNNLKGVEVEKGEAGTYDLYATDGFRLIKINIPDREYTITPEETKAITTPKIILSGVLEQLVKVINKNSAKLPMADKAWIHDDGIYYNNLECDSKKVIMEAKEVFLEKAIFPQVAHILNGFKDKKVSVSLNAALLSDVAKTFKNGGTNIIRITLGDTPTAPVLFEGLDEEHNKIQAVLMPVRTAE